MWRVVQSIPCVLVIHIFDNPLLFVLLILTQWCLQSVIYWQTGWYVWPDLLDCKVQLGRLLHLLPRKHYQFALWFVPSAGLKYALLYYFIISHSPQQLAWSVLTRKHSFWIRSLLTVDGVVLSMVWAGVPVFLGCKTVCYVCYQCWSEHSSGGTYWNDIKLAMENMLSWCGYSIHSQ